MKIEFKIKDRPIYSKWISFKYSFIFFVFGKVSPAEYYDMLKEIGLEDDPRYRLDNLTDN